MKPVTPNPHTLAVRCLNETRVLHPPTYVAARFLADSVASDVNSSWTLKTITRRYPVQATPRFFKFMRFKKQLENRQIEYREFLVPSPMTCLTESFVLQELSGLRPFRKPNSVYSYRWPSHPACPYNFDHYANGYIKRNENISDTLRRNPSSIVIITDIKKFYPTIPREIVRERFKNRLNGGSISPSVRDTALNLFEHLVSTFPQGKGIATGPDLSHVIGDLALSELDEEFNLRYPGRYFRYVDDIIFVIDPEERQNALQLLNNFLNNVNLEANNEKEDTVSSEEWLSHGPHYQRVITDNSFEALVFRLKVFLAIKPGRLRGLESAFRDQGFSLPITKVANAASTSLFHRRLKLFYRRRWKVMLNALFETEKSLVDLAITVRQGIEERLVSLFESGFPTAVSRRKWHIQRIRHLTNRSLYLWPASELGFVRHALVDHPEFAETVALLRLLQDGDSSDLLEMPGPAVSTAGAILRASKTTAKTIKLPTNLSAAAKHSAGILLLYGVAEFDPTLLQASDPDAAEFLSFCAGKAPQGRERNDFGYLDEIRSLQLNHNTEERLQMLENRFSEDEAITFEALEIGGEYFT